MPKYMKNVELLAPAGNMLQAQNALAAGCDALYGGLMSWNARNRAENLGLDDYSTIITECKKLRKKFYLTLNTLVTDEEINKIGKLLVSGNIPLPNALIIADVGLMRILHELLPSVPIHASTQSGIMSSEDANWFERLGVTRAILSRELRLSEIENLKKHTGLELEVFIYGSQCITFSGQCLWGGILHGCSGNRGHCIGMCRDIYTAQGIIGQFFYPHDLFAIDSILSLIKIGVKSFKIEGRMRSPQEIYDITNIFRRFIDGIDLNIEESYSGYLGNGYHTRNMFNLVNPRVKTIHDIHGPYTSADILVLNKRGRKEICIGSEANADGEIKFLKSSFTKHLSESHENIYLKLLHNTEGGVIGFDYINTNGERRKISIKPENTSWLRIEELYLLISNSIPANIYEFTADLPASYDVGVNINSIKTALHSIQCKSETTIIKTEYVDFDTDDDICEVDGIEQLKAAKNFGFKNFLLIASDEQFISEVQNICGGLDRVTFKLPLIDFRHGINKLMNKLVGKSVMLARISQIELLKGKKYKQISIDYSANVYNTYTVNLLVNSGIESITLSPELPFPSAYAGFAERNLEMQFLYWGKIPVGVSRGCFGSLGLCNKKCHGLSGEYTNMAKGYSLSLFCNKENDVRTLVPNKVFFAGNSYPEGLRKRLSFCYFSAEEVRCLLEQLKNRRLLANRNIYGRVAI